MPMDPGEKNEAFEKCGQIGLTAMHNLESWLKDYHTTTMPLFSPHTLPPISPSLRGDTQAALNAWLDAGAPSSGGLMERALLEQPNVGRLWDAIQDEDFEAIEEWQWRADKSFFTRESVADTWRVMVEGVGEEEKREEEKGEEGGHVSGEGNGSVGRKRQAECENVDVGKEEGEKEDSGGKAGEGTSSKVV